LLASESADLLPDALHDVLHDKERDSLRAFEIPDRDPIAVSTAVEFNGQIAALWPDGSGTAATAIVRKKDTGWYEAYRVSVTCGN
jgi:hypothetical protein